MFSPCCPFRITEVVGKECVLVAVTGVGVPMETAYISAMTLYLYCGHAGQDVPCFGVHRVGRQGGERLREFQWLDGSIHVQCCVVWNSFSWRGREEGGGEGGREGGREREGGRGEEGGGGREREGGRGRRRGRGEEEREGEGGKELHTVLYFLFCLLPFSISYSSFCSCLPYSLTTELW